MQILASCQDQPVLRREKIQVDIAFDFFFFCGCVARCAWKMNWMLAHARRNLASSSNFALNLVFRESRDEGLARASPLSRLFKNSKIEYLAASAPQPVSKPPNIKRKLCFWHNPNQRVHIWTFELKSKPFPLFFEFFPKIAIIYMLILATSQLVTHGCTCIASAWLHTT